jgi:threonine synthase
MRLSDSALVMARELFSSFRCDDSDMVEVIRKTNIEKDYLLDPHTAIGLLAARNCRIDHDTPMVTLATAHPAKFPEAVKKAGYPRDPELPSHVADLFDRDEYFTVLDDDQNQVHQFMKDNI